MTSEMIELIDHLKNNSYEAEIHGLNMLVKPIPDPIDETVLDPRAYVYKKKLAEEMEKNGGAEMPETPEAMIKMLRDEPAYPSRDVTSIDIEKEEKTVSTRNGDIKIYVYKASDVADSENIKKKGTYESSTNLKPAIIFYHGGAFFMGSTLVVENFCKLLVQEADAVVIGVDYHLAPEYLYPVGMFDCYDAFEWVYENADELGVDKHKICLAGDSAGGTLAIQCSIIERDKVLNGELDKSRIRYQALIYPAVFINNVRTDDYKWKLSDYEIPDTDFIAMGSATELKLTSEVMAGIYMGENGRVTDPLAAPIFQESLEGLPQTFMAICEFDYLRLSDEAFGRMMNRDGVVNRVVIYKGMDHSFIDKVGDCPQAVDVAMEIAKDIKAFELK